MTLKKSLALTIIIVLILVLEGCVVLADRRPVDPYNHTLGDTLFTFTYSNFFLPAVIGFLFGVYEIIDRPVFAGKKGVLKVILAYLRVTLALILNMAFWVVYTKSNAPIINEILCFLRNSLPGGIIIFTITFAIGSAVFPGRPRGPESEITPEVRFMRRRQTIALLANAAIFTAVAIWANHLRYSVSNSIINIFSMRLFIAPVILGVSWGVYENIARPVLSRKNGFAGIILPFVRAAIIQWMMLLRYDLVITINLCAFPKGTFVLTTVIGLTTFFITCAVFACPPEFLKTYRQKRKHTRDS